MDSKHQLIHGLFVKNRKPWMALDGDWEMIVRLFPDY